MRILHVSLGLPPLRTGGLNRYCSELMQAQVSAGNTVFLVFPGRFLPGSVRFHRGLWHGVATFELINPLPVALTYGIADPAAFIAPCSNTEKFRELFELCNPDVIHVHSYMGIYIEFFISAKDRGIPMVFTTHDYYPMCPRCTFIDSMGHECDTGADSRSCSVCCLNGMTLRKSMVMQSGTYAFLKSSGLIKGLTLAVRKNMASKDRIEVSRPFAEKKSADYQILLNYNERIFRLFDLILTNSTMAEMIYKKFFPESIYRRIRISHAGLSFAPTSLKKKGDNDSITIGYFGGKKEYKGFSTLLAAAHELHDKKIRFTLRLYGDEYTGLDIPEISSCGYVSPGDMGGILRGLDVVVVPSIYHETFGFVVLEALCEGSLVICSDAVGARDLINDDAIFPAGDSRKLTNLIIDAAKGKLTAQSLPADYPITVDEQASEMNRCYRVAGLIHQ